MSVSNVGVSNSEKQAEAAFQAVVAAASAAAAAYNPIIGLFVQLCGQTMFAAAKQASTQLHCSPTPPPKQGSSSPTSNDGYAAANPPKACSVGKTSKSSKQSEATQADIAAREQRIKDYETIQKYFGTAESAGAFFGIRDGILTQENLQVCARDPGVPEELRLAAQRLLADPHGFAGLDKMGLTETDGNVLGSDVIAAIAKEKAAVRALKSGKPVPETSSQTELDKKGREALKVILDNFKTAESQSAFFGTQDGILIGADIFLLARRPGASKEVVAAAQFLERHPEYLKQADAVGLADGHITKGDLEQAIKDLGTKITKAAGAVNKSEVNESLPSAPAGSKELHSTQSKKSKSTSASSDNMKQILDSDLPLEDKVMLCIENSLKELDDQIREAGDELQARTEDKDSTDSSSMEVIARKLQRLIERRSAMYQLMSNLSSSFHEMTMSAIRNLGKS